MVEWTSRIHDTPAEELITVFRTHEAISIAEGFLAGGRDFRVQPSPICTLVTKHITAIPDLTVSISSMEAQLEKHLLIFECAFSQTRVQLFAKLKKIAKSLPDLDMLCAVLIHEERKYRSPVLTSTTWDRFEKDPSILNLSQFLQLVKNESNDSNQSQPVSAFPENFMGPVSAGEHVWCNINRVQYYVWLRGDDGKLRVDRDSIEPTQWFAYGVRPTVSDVVYITCRGFGFV
jgi:hypothetical protein